MCAHVHATILYTCALRLSKYVCTQPSHVALVHTVIFTLGTRRPHARPMQAHRPSGWRGGPGSQGCHGGAAVHYIHRGSVFITVRAGGTSTRQAGQRASSGRPAASGTASPHVAAATSRGGSVIRGGEGGGRRGEQGVDGTAAAGLLESISGPASPAGSKQRGTAGLTAATGLEAACCTHHSHSHVRVPPDGESSSRRH